MLRLFACFTSLTLATCLFAADWPQWRGPRRDGVSTETGLLKQWPKDGPKLVWTFKDAGLGFSSFAIADGKLYTLGTKGEDEVVLCLDAVKGTELWSAKIGPIFTFNGNTWGDGPRGTPTLDGNRLYALGGQGELVALDIAKNGAELWRKNLIKDFDGEMMTEWGYSESPLVDGDQLIVTPGSKKGTIAALNKATGALIWLSKDLDHKAPYSSAIAADIHGVRQYIQLSYLPNTGGFVNGVAAKDGKLLWQAPIFRGDSYAACPTPIVKDNLVYVTTGYGGGCHAFDIDKDFKAVDRFGKKEQKSVKNTHGGVVMLDGKIYGHSEGLGWVCQDLTKGKIAWNERDALSTKSGAITAAEGMLYLFTEDGEVALVKASPEAFELVSSFNLPALSKFPETRNTSRSSKAWSYPVIANGKLFVRDCELVYCYDVTAK